MSERFRVAEISLMWSRWMAKCETRILMLFVFPTFVFISSKYCFDSCFHVRIVYSGFLPLHGLQIWTLYWFCLEEIQSHPSSKLYLGWLHISIRMFVLCPLELSELVCFQISKVVFIFCDLFKFNTFKGGALIDFESRTHGVSKKKKHQL